MVEERETTTEDILYEHSLTNVDEIVVDLNDLLDCIERNRQGTRNGQYVLRVAPTYGSFDDTVQAKIHFSEKGRHYRDYDGPEPVHISPAAILLGSDTARLPDLPKHAQYPGKTVDRDIYDQDAADDISWEEWREETLRRWRNEVQVVAAEQDSVTVGTQTSQVSACTVDVTIVNSK